ncbi:MAG: response regulator [Dysgonomonas sp.]|nr:response regulator [Dysgonomonas sp.]
MLLFPLSLKAYNLRQISSKNGLSSSAVLRVYQDNNRLIWLGTYDGLNIYDGVNVQTYKPDKEKNSLSGNIIKRIVETEDGTFWIHTNLGLDKFIKNKGYVKSYNREKVNVLCKNSQNQLFLISKSDSISVYNTQKDRFEQFALKGIVKEAIIHFSFDSNDILWLITSDGTINRYRIKVNEGTISSIDKLASFEYPDKVRYAYSTHDMLCLVGVNGNFSVVNRQNDRVHFVRNIRNEVEYYGGISDIIPDKDEYLISFQTAGVIKLYPNGLGQYEVERINLDCGIFSMYKDEIQDIVWFATDGQGAIIYSRDDYSLKTETFTMLHDKIKKPVRAIYHDKENNLWIGTKGDGILKHSNYNRSKTNISASDLSVYKKGSSELRNNSVFAFASSIHDLFWIGSDGPELNYYSYKSKNIQTLKSIVPVDVTFIHSILEQNDSTLWLASSGNGLQRLILSYSNGEPQIKESKQFLFFDSGNNYYTVIAENDSILWIGSRGNGAVRFNTITEKHQVIQLKKEKEQMMNDILCIFIDMDKTVWLGTSLGLNKLISYNGDSVIYQNYNESDGLSNNTIHGILEDEKGTLWLSTNNGIGRFNKQTSMFDKVTNHNGNEIIEFSDNAYYEYQNSDMLFFGGVDGLVSIEIENEKNKAFDPDIYFYGLKIYGNDSLIDEYMVSGDNESSLVLPYKNNFFSISFVAVDFVNGPNYVYQYQLEGFSDQWINNGTSNIVSFTNIPPGEYMLHVRYKSTNTISDSSIYTLPIVILPPWYKTMLAYIIYTVLILLLIFFIVKLVRKWYVMKKNTVIARITQQQKEEIYESKLRFFTNITHELCTPLTLIYGPCEKIISLSRADGHLLKYASLIKYNAEKLNTLIQELIEFRRLETGNMPLKVSGYDISEHTRDIAEAFIDLAETRNIEYHIIIPDNIYWSTDKSSYSKILTNLISNAFKYTLNNGLIKVEVSLTDNNLILGITNTGKGIKEENISKIFDRYQILDNFEMNSERGLSNRNGLGLAICYNMVKLLSGSIEVTSILNESTQFIVTLPRIDENESQRIENTYQQEIPKLLYDEVIDLDLNVSPFDKMKPTILIADDDEEMLWFISQMFIEKYNVISVNDSLDVIEYMKNNKIDLVILDVMMPDKDGIALTKEIKSNKILSHIPLILLSAKNHNEDQIEGIESGAEMYITKPFNVEYLEKVVDQLLQRDEILKKYYNSVFSAVDIKDGRIIHKEESVFLEKLTEIIDQNLSNADLSVEQISTSLGMSVRHFYRKLKKTTDKTPSEIIREYRFKAVEKYLVTTNMTIDEIIYYTGFNNRSNFYKIFFKTYGVTPKKYRELNTKDISFDKKN